MVTNIFLFISFTNNLMSGVITYNEFIKLATDSKMKDITHYLEKIHQTKPNKRTRDSSTAFLDPYEHIDFKPLFDSLRERYVLRS